MGDVGQRELSGPQLGHRGTILRALRRGPKLNRALRELTGISSTSLTGALATLRRLGAGRVARSPC
jgi:DNA-binding HxlR family transcriptional regulator